MVNHEEQKMKNKICTVAWVANPWRDSGYSLTEVKSTGGKIIKECQDRQTAESICLKLNKETEGSAGGYVVVPN